MALAGMCEQFRIASTCIALTYFAFPGLTAQ